jgi:hypothetical protein
MSAASLLRRLLLCGLTLCVAGAGAAPYALPRPAEAEEAETQAEEFVSPAVANRDSSKEFRRALPVARSAPVAKGRPSRRPVADAALRPTLRALEVRLQV